MSKCKDVKAKESMSSLKPNVPVEKAVEIEKGKWQIKGMEGKIPMVYTVRAIKQ